MNNKILITGTVILLISCFGFAEERSVFNKYHNRRVVKELKLTKKQNIKIKEHMESNRKEVKVIREKILSNRIKLRVEMDKVSYNQTKVSDLINKAGEFEKERLALMVKNTIEIKGLLTKEQYKVWRRSMDRRTKYEKRSKNTRKKRFQEEDACETK